MTEPTPPFSFDDCLPMKSDRVQERTIKLPGWHRTPDGGALTRAFELPTARAAAAFVAYVAELAEAASHHPEIEIRERRVTLTLAGPEPGEPGELDEAACALAKWLG
jgi:4a-hydroxytetrahydrobiopterin dehydratase